jgi:hypothetical protein
MALSVGSDVGEMSHGEMAQHTTEPGPSENVTKYDAKTFRFREITKRSFRSVTGM